MAKGPVLIEFEDEAASLGPDEAPAVPELAQEFRSTSMQQVASLAARRPSRLARWFWSLLVALVGFVVSLAAWDYVNALILRSPVLGKVITALLALFCLGEQ